MASSSTSMAVDPPKAPKIDVDQYLSEAIAATPRELHPYFDAFKSLHHRKSAPPFLTVTYTPTEAGGMCAGYGTS